MRKNIGEILQELDGVSGKQAKADFLKEHKTPALVQFLGEFVNDSSGWAYEDAELPEYIVDCPPDGYSETTLANEMRRLYLFRKGTNITERRRDELFVQIVECLTEYEARVFVALVQGKKLPPKLMTKNFVNDLFAGKI